MKTGSTQHTSTHRHNTKCASLCSFVVGLYLMVGHVYAESILYRYVNDEGIQVINHAIPPELVKNGYEIIDINGKVIKEIPPARTEAEINAEYARKKLAMEYEKLRKRYASVEDLEAAKMRRLESINTNIAIIRSNISSINTRIENLMGQAASQERAGRKVSKDILQNIETAKAELTVTENLLELRVQEQQEVNDKFDSDVATFVKGNELIEATN